MSREIHVVGIVGNDITIDSRVKRVAATAAAAGFKSTVICHSPSGERTEGSMGDVQIIREPVPFAVQRAPSRLPQVLRPIVGTELAHRHLGPRTRQLARKRRLEADLEVFGSRGTWLKLQLLRVSMRLRRDGFRLRRWGHVAWDRSKRRYNLARVHVRARLSRRFGDRIPAVSDYEAALGAVIEELKPDLIHAHDFQMIGVAVTAARRLRKKGIPTKVVYDAHELIEGLNYPPRVIAGWLAEEESFIKDVDAVIAVSPEQSSLIANRYRLDPPPTVVMNAPVTHGRSNPVTTVREDAGTDGKILVYHGKVDRERGVYTLVEALAFMGDDVHVVIMAQVESAVTNELKAIAESLSAEDRLHILGFAPAEQLPEYLASADVAVAPFLRTGNTDVSLPNKLFEAIQADLPVLTSNTTALTKFVNHHGIGRVFEAGQPKDLAIKALLLLDEIDEIRDRITPELRYLASWDAQSDRLLGVYSDVLEAEPQEDARVRIRDLVESDRQPEGLHRPISMAIGPRNMAGQAYAIANAVQSHLGIPTFSFSVERPEYEFPIHQQIHSDDWNSPPWQIQQRRLLATSFSHVLAESGTGVLGSMNGGFIDDQLPTLTEDGVQVAVLLHGSEIRDPRRHKHLQFSPYAIADKVTVSLERVTARLRRHLSNIDVPVFVTTPDLLGDIDAVWLPVVVDTTKWAELEEPFTSDVPTVLHLPSRGRLKGTEYVDPILFRLEEEGRISYLRPSEVHSSGVPDLIQQADIVIDGIVIGAYGVMSCQAMAAGRLSVAGTRELGSLRVRCPIIEADPGTLETVLRDLLADKDTWKGRAEAGREFVSTFHDGAYTSQRLRPFLGLSENG